MSSGLLYKTYAWNSFDFLTTYTKRAIYKQAQATQAKNFRKKLCAGIQFLGYAMAQKHQFVIHPTLFEAILYQ